MQKLKVITYFYLPSFTHILFNLMFSYFYMSFNSFWKKAGYK